MRRGRYAPPATLNLGLSAWRCALRKGKVWRLARHNHQERTNVHSYTNPLTLCSFPLGKARMGLSSGNSVGVAISQPRVEVRSASTLGIGTKKDSNSVGVALSRRRYRSTNISGTAANITIINSKQGDTKIQKAVVTAVGFAWVCLSVTPVRKRVFLRVVPTIPTVMHGMTTAATTVKKAALGRSKSPPLAVQKHSIESPSLAIPIGREFLLAVFREIAVFFPFHHLGSSGSMIVGCITNDM